MPTELQRKIARLYGGEVQDATPAQIHRTLYPGDYLAPSEREQIDDIVAKTGVPLQVVLDYFTASGRYCGERKTSFIKAIINAKERHGESVANYIKLEDINYLGHLKDLGVILKRRPRN